MSSWVRPDEPQVTLHHQAQIELHEVHAIDVTSQRLQETFM
jgi:hypothetical protein